MHCRTPWSRAGIFTAFESGIDELSVGGNKIISVERYRSGEDAWRIATRENSDRTRAIFQNKTPPP